MPHLITNTVDNLWELSPTLYFNVPKGFNDLLPYLEADSSLRDHFFSNLDAIFYAGACPQDLWDRLENLSTAARQERVPMISAWGATETSPVVTSVHFTIPRAGVIGLPAPGCTLKMVPSGQQLELRVKGRTLRLAIGEMTFKLGKHSTMKGFTALAMRAFRGC